MEQMDPQQTLVHAHIAALEAEAVAARLAVAAQHTDPKPSIRESLGRKLIAVGALIAATPIADDPCADAGAAHRA